MNLDLCAGQECIAAGARRILIALDPWQECGGNGICEHGLSKFYCRVSFATSDDPCHCHVLGLVRGAGMHCVVPQEDGDTLHANAVGVPMQKVYGDVAYSDLSAGLVRSDHGAAPRLV